MPGGRPDFTSPTPITQIDSSDIADLPEVTKISPGRSSSGTNPDSSFVLTFSKGMNDETTVRGVWEEALAETEVPTADLGEAAVKIAGILDAPTTSAPKVDVWEVSEYDAQPLDDVPEMPHIPPDAGSAGQGPPPAYLVELPDGSQAGPPADVNPFHLSPDEFEEWRRTFYDCPPPSEPPPAAPDLSQGATPLELEFFDPSGGIDGGTFDLGPDVPAYGQPIIGFDPIDPGTLIGPGAPSAASGPPPVTGTPPPVVVPGRSSTWRTVTIAVLVLFLVLTGTFAATGIGIDEQLPANLEGPCVGFAVVENGPTIDPSISGGVYVVPLDGRASYEGRVDGVEERERPAASGRVTIATPPLFPPIPVGGSWPSAGNTITGVRSTGVRTWTIPAWTPRSTIFTIHGEHDDERGIHCEGDVALALEGDPSDSPVFFATWVTVIVLVLILVFAARNRGSRVRDGLAPRGHPVLGVVVGAVLGIATGLGLTVSGMQPLDGPAVTGLLPTGALLGLSLAMWAPLGRTE